MRETWLAGVDIGGTKTAVVLSAAPPEITQRIEFPTAPREGPEPALRKVRSALHRMLSEQGITSARLAGIGISCGGPLDQNTGVIQAPPNLPTWIDVPIVNILSQEFNCPARLENDANAGAVAEHRFGAGRGFRHVLFLTFGTGLGAGIIIDNQLYRGANGLAGEIGHVRLTRSGPVGYHKAGSAEGWSSGAGIAQIAESAVQAAQRTGRKTQLLDHPAAHGLTARDVAQAAQSGDRLAQRIVRMSGKKLGMALAILVDLFNPECIVIGGLAVRLGSLILDPARESLKKEGLLPAVEVCKLAPSHLAERIGDVAALCVAMDAVSKRTRA